MGSLALAGAIGGVGKGMVANVARENENEQKNLDRMRDEMLQTMRDEAGMAQVDKKQEYATENYDKQRTDMLKDLQTEHEYEAGVLKGGYAREDTTREDEQSHAMDLQRLKNTGALDVADKKNNPTNWQSVKLKAKVGVDQFGFAVEEEIPLSYHKPSGKYYQEKGGMLLPYDMVSNLPEDEGILATDPMQAMNYANAKGGADSLPKWFKQAHPEIYKAVKRDLQGGGSKEDDPDRKSSIDFINVDTQRRKPSRPPTGNVGDAISRVGSDMFNAIQAENPGSISPEQLQRGGLLREADKATGGRSY